MSNTVPLGSRRFKVRGCGQRFKVRGCGQRFKVRGCGDESLTPVVEDGFAFDMKRLTVLMLACVKRVGFGMGARSVGS